MVANQPMHRKWKQKKVPLERLTKSLGVNQRTDRRSSRRSRQRSRWRSRRKKCPQRNQKKEAKKVRAAKKWLQKAAKVKTHWEMRPSQRKYISFFALIWKSYGISGSSNLIGFFFLSSKEENANQTAKKSSTLTCVSPAYREFPSDLLNHKLRAHGFIIIHILVATYMFYCLAIVCDHYFLTSLEECASVSGHSSHIFDHHQSEGRVVQILHTIDNRIGSGDTEMVCFDQAKMYPFNRLFGEPHDSRFTFCSTISNRFRRIDPRFRFFSIPIESIATLILGIAITLVFVWPLRLREQLLRIY